jgi:hypothetical protein
MSEFPKWVVPDESHVVRASGRGPVAPEFAETHVDRFGGLTVLIGDGAEEARALSAAPNAESAAVEAGAEAEENHDNKENQQ